LLTLEFAIVSPFLVFVLYRLIRWFARLTDQVAPAFRNGHERILAALRAVERVMELVRSASVWVVGIAEGMRAGVAVLRSTPRKGR